MNTTPIDHKIEFMAWDKDNKCFVNGDVCFGYDDFDWVVLNNNYEQILWNSNGELLQLTALRSINDEPIYNHMIVKEEKSGDLFCVDMFYYNLMAWLSNRRIEIVGNRFQHEELLELCK